LEISSSSIFPSRFGNFSCIENAFGTVYTVNYKSHWAQVGGFIEVGLSRGYTYTQ
jgi:hypothetical protein